MKDKKIPLKSYRNPTAIYAVNCALVGEKSEASGVCCSIRGKEIGIDESMKYGILNSVQMDSYVNYFALTKTAVSHHTYQNTFANTALAFYSSCGIAIWAGNQEMSPRDITYVGLCDYLSSTIAVVSELKCLGLSLNESYGIHIRERCG